MSFLSSMYGILVTKEKKMPSSLHFVNQAICVFVDIIRFIKEDLLELYLSGTHTLLSSYLYKGKEYAALR